MLLCDDTQCNLISNVVMESGWQVLFIMVVLVTHGIMCGSYGGQQCLESQQEDV